MCKAQKVGKKGHKTYDRWECGGPGGGRGHLKVPHNSTCTLGPVKGQRLGVLYHSHWWCMQCMNSPHEQTHPQYISTIDISTPLGPKDNLKFHLKMKVEATVPVPALTPRPPYQIKAHHSSRGKRGKGGGVVVCHQRASLLKVLKSTEIATLLSHRPPGQKHLYFGAGCPFFILYLVQTWISWRSLYTREYF